MSQNDISIKFISSTSIAIKSIHCMILTMVFSDSPKTRWCSPSIEASLNMRSIEAKELVCHCCHKISRDSIAWCLLFSNFQKFVSSSCIHCSQKRGLISQIHIALMIQLKECRWPCLNHTTKSETVQNIDEWLLVLHERCFSIEFWYHLLGFHFQKGFEFHNIESINM